MAVYGKRMKFHRKVLCQDCGLQRAVLRCRPEERDKPVSRGRCPRCEEFRRRAFKTEGP